MAKGYFFSAWIPAVSTLIIFGLLFLNERWAQIPNISLLLMLGVPIGLVGLLVSGIVQAKGGKLSSVITFLTLPVVLLVIWQGMGVLMFAALFDDRPDNFGKDIVIPADMKLSDPVESFDETNGPVTDEFTESVIAAFSATNAVSVQTNISTDLTVLNEFGTTNRQKLIQYLASSPQWFVTEERGKPYAYRRLAVEGRWQNELNGYFTDFEIAPGSASHFQTRIVIGFDGPVFAEPFEKKSTTAQVGTGAVPIEVVDDKESDQGKESYFVLQSSRAAVEIFEQSRLDARPVTQLAIADLKHEFEMALAASDSSAPSQKSPPAIELAKGSQGGIYQVRAFVNPGEAGKVYVKVFEATRNTPLSEDRIKPVSTSRIGWSTNSNETFRYQSEITVYEGDWGTFYPGRFELWFVPDSGSPERKLIDRIFRIEGWMR